MLFGRRLLSPFKERIGRKLLVGRASVGASGLGMMKVGTGFVFMVHLLLSVSWPSSFVTVASAYKRGVNRPDDRGDYPTSTPLKRVVLKRSSRMIR